jgi:Flp pilus assembly protein CpaB
MRALTIPIEYIQGLASYITTGTKVDIVSATKSETKESNLIVQNVEVVSFEMQTRVGGDTGTPPVNSISAVTFQIPAAAIPKVVEAVVKGKIQIATRNNADKEQITVAVKPKPITTSFNAPPIKALPLPYPTSTFSLPPLNASDLPMPAAPPKKAKPVKKVEFIQANVKTDLSFEK